VAWVTGAAHAHERPATILAAPDRCEIAAAIVIVERITVARVAVERIIVACTIAACTTLDRQLPAL
jgi:hypothetical protein